jgi:predicted RNA binding protein YcfA (HicA-like mRNA interferase family)
VFKKFTKFGKPTCSQVKTALKKMGFTSEGQKGTSHEQWSREVKGRLYKVTVDCPKAPFGDILTNSMASQAGVSKQVFLQYCFDKKTKGDPFKQS